MKKGMLVFFTVNAPAGRSFPIDMLRYDGCWPATEADSAKITHRMEHELDEARPIVLKAHYGYGAPTFARWKSFGWEAHAPYF